MTWPARVYILCYPMGSGLCLCSAKACSNRQASRYAADRLVEEARVARSQLPDELVHTKLELFRVIARDNLSSRLPCESGPVCPIEPRIEILLRDLCRRLVENFNTLSECQISRK